MNYQAISKIFFLPVLILITSCGGIIKSYIRKDVGNVPADFGKGPTTILVVKWKKKYNNTLESDFGKYYKGEYKLVSNEELATTYADVSKYRSLFGGTLEIFNSHNTVTGMLESSSGSLSFQLVDRTNNKFYETGGSSGVSWRTVETAYIKKIETVRARNASK